MRDYVSFRRKFPPALAITIALAPATFADWPQWRGPNRDGHAAGVSAPAKWPEKLTRKWTVEVGEGHSSPIVAGGVIFVHTRLGDRETVSAIRPGTGAVVWRQTYPAPYTVNPAATRHGKGVKSTPVVSNGRLYTLGISETLSCWEAATGKLLWGREASPEATGWRAYSPMIRGEPLFQKASAPATFGTAMSPLVDNGVVIVHLGAAGLAAFDTETGDERWSWKDDRPGYASPVLFEVEGTRQIVTQSEKHIISVSAADGRLVWKIPYTTSFNQNSVTPVVMGRDIIFSGLNNGTMAIRPVKRGEEWIPEKLWENTEVSMYMSSPAIAGGVLYGFSEKQRGSLFALDPKSGKTLWSGAPRQGENAALIVSGDKLLVLTTDGRLNVASFGRDGVETVAEYKVAETPTWAHPAIVEGGILIKDLGSLALWSWQ